MNRLLTTVAVMLLLVFPLSAQTPVNEFWTPVDESAIAVTGARQIIPSVYFTAKLNVPAIKAVLFAARDERNTNIRSSNSVITVIDPKGRLIRCSVVESPVMDERLSASFPDMKTFSIRGVDDNRVWGKIDWNEFGFHGMVYTTEGNFFIDPYCVSNTADYISYYAADFQKRPEHRLAEVGLLKDEPGEEEKKSEPAESKQQSSAPDSCVGSLIKSYRLAIATTGEYAIAATGLPAPTLAQTLAKVQTSVNRVNGVFESEVSVRMVLVAASTLVIYTDPATDSFTGTANMNANQLIGLSQTIITASVGTANFDIGHTFSTGGGGLAMFGSVCDPENKASGITGSSNPVGDPYDIDFVAHEMGHQFGANHSFNGTTSGCVGMRYHNTSVEPGSGITIMSYAGLCGSNDISNHSIPYFHAISYDEIVKFTNNPLKGGQCVTLINTGNSPPSITGAGTHIIPKGTPFFLTGSGTDPDGDALLYSWEETDHGAAGGNWNSGNKPFFRSYAPDTSATRYFPNKSVVLSGNYQGTMGEFLPNTPQVLNFRLTGRGMNMGGICFAQSKVTLDTVGPFIVVYPSLAGITWRSGTQTSVMWDPAFTYLAPVSCDSVRIFISYDSGNTYQVLVNSAPNTGVYQLAVPVVTVIINTCRIKVQGLDMIFYDISDNDFSVVPANTAITEETSVNNPFALAAWPNPVGSVLHVVARNLGNREPATVVITDLLGKELYREVFSGRDHLTEQIDMSSFENGLYFVILYSGGNQSVHRVVKQ